MKQILSENENVRVEMDNNISFLLWKGSAIDINIAKDGVQCRLSVIGGNSYPILINIKSVKTVSKEARDYLAGKEGCKGVVAAAILIDSVVGSMIGNFFMRVNKPLVPTRIFTDELEATKWLSQFIEKN